MSEPVAAIIGGVIGILIGQTILLLWWEIRWRRQFSESMIYSLFKEFVLPHITKIRRKYIDRFN